MAGLPCSDTMSLRYPKSNKFAEQLAGRFFVAGVSGRFRKTRRKGADDDEKQVVDPTLAADIKQAKRLRKEEQIRHDARRIHELETKLEEIQHNKLLRRNRDLVRQRKKAEYLAVLLLERVFRRFLCVKKMRNKAADAMVDFLKSIASRQAVRAAGWAAAVITRFVNMRREEAKEAADVARQRTLQTLLEEEEEELRLDASADSEECRSGCSSELDGQTSLFDPSSPATESTNSPPVDTNRSLNFSISASSNFSANSSPRPCGRPSSAFLSAQKAGATGSYKRSDTRAIRRRSMNKGELEAAQEEDVVRVKKLHIHLVRDRSREREQRLQAIEELREQQERNLEREVRVKADVAAEKQIAKDEFIRTVKMEQIRCAREQDKVRAMRERKKAQAVGEKDRELAETRLMYREDHRVMVLLSRRSTLRVPKEEAPCKVFSPAAIAEKIQQEAIAAERAQRLKQSAVLLQKRTAAKLRAEVQQKKEQEEAESVRRKLLLAQIASNALGALQKRRPTAACLPPSFPLSSQSQSNRDPDAIQVLTKKAPLIVRKKRKKSFDKPLDTEDGAAAVSLIQNEDYADLTPKAPILGSGEGALSTYSPPPSAPASGSVSEAPSPRTSSLATAPVPAQETPPIPFSTSSHPLTVPYKTPPLRPSSSAPLPKRDTTKKAPPPSLSQPPKKASVPTQSRNKTGSDSVVSTRVRGSKSSTPRVPSAPDSCSTPTGADDDDSSQHSRLGKVASLLAVVSKARQDTDVSDPSPLGPAVEGESDLGPGSWSEPTELAWGSTALARAAADSVSDSELFDTLPILPITATAAAAVSHTESPSMLPTPSSKSSVSKALLSMDGTRLPTHLPRPSKPSSSLRAPFDLTYGMPRKPSQVPHTSDKVPPGSREKKAIGSTSNCTDLSYVHPSEVESNTQAKARMKSTQRAGEMEAKRSSAVTSAAGSASTSRTERREALALESTSHPSIKCTVSDVSTSSRKKSMGIIRKSRKASKRKEEEEEEEEEEAALAEEYRMLRLRMQKNVSFTSARVKDEPPAEHGEQGGEAAYSSERSQEYDADPGRYNSSSMMSKPSKTATNESRLKDRNKDKGKHEDKEKDRNSVSFANNLEEKAGGRGAQREPMSEAIASMSPKAILCFFQEQDRLEEDMSTEEDSGDEAEGAEGEEDGPSYRSVGCAGYEEMSTSRGVGCVGQYGADASDPQGTGRRLHPTAVSGDNEYKYDNDDSDESEDRDEDGSGDRDGGGGGDRDEDGDGGGENVDNYRQGSEESGIRFENQCDENDEYDDDDEVGGEQDEYSDNYESEDEVSADEG